MVYKIGHWSTGPLPESDMLEGFLIEALSFNQIAWIKPVNPKDNHIPKILGASASRDQNAVYEAHFTRRKEPIIRLRASLMNIPAKYWEEYVLPGLIEYAKTWNCRFEYVERPDDQVAIFFYLNYQPFSVKRKSRVIHRFIATFGQTVNSPYKDNYYVVNVIDRNAAFNELNYLFGRWWSMVYDTEESAGVYQFGLTEIKKPTLGKHKLERIPR